MVLAAVRRGAFFGALSDNLKENIEYTRKTSDAMQEYLWTAGLNRRNEVNKSRAQLQEAYDYLISEGLEEDKGKALLDRDPRGLLEFYKVAQNYKLKSGRLSSNILNSAVTMAEGYEAPDMTASELLKKATPDVIEGAKLDPPEQERSFLGKLFGTPSMDEIRYDVYSSEIMGRKGSDIMASISEPTIRARDTAGGVRTDYTGLGAISVPDLLKLESELEDRYKGKVTTKLDELIILAGKAQRNEDNYSPADLTNDEGTGIQDRVNKLKEIQDLETANEQMIAAMKNPDIGFSLAQEYFMQVPQMFTDRPRFISNELLPFISGENTTTTEPTEDSPEDPPGDIPGDPPGDIPGDPPGDTPGDTPEYPSEFFIKEIEEGEDPEKAARNHFMRNPVGEDIVGSNIVGIKMPDGTIRFFKFKEKRSQGLGFPDKIIINDVTSTITGQE